LGAILAQEQDGVERVIAYTGRGMLDAERRYSVTEKEALAVFYAVKQFDQYIRHHKVKIIVDHSPLCYLFKKCMPSNRLAKWAYVLNQYDYEVIYKPGRTHTNADFVSRLPYETVIPAEDLEPNVPPYLDALQVGGQDVDTGITEECTADALTPEKIKIHQRRDPTLIPLIQYLEEDRLPETKEQTNRILWQADSHFLIEGVLYHEWFRRKQKVADEQIRHQVVIPVDLQNIVLEAYHDEPLSGHRGVPSTETAIRRNYFWKSMATDIQTYVRSCHVCNRREPLKKSERAPLCPLPVGTPWENIQVDILGPFPKSNTGAQFVLVCICTFTRWAEYIALKEITAPTTAKALFERIYCRFGSPKHLQSDQGKNFVSVMVKELCKVCGTKQVTSSSYHSQSQGAVERLNQTLSRMISKYVHSSQENWNEYLAPASYAHNTRTNEATGFSPFLLLYGRDPMLPLDVGALQMTGYNKGIRAHLQDLLPKITYLEEEARSNAERDKEVMKKYYDKVSKDRSFEIGDKVWLYLPVTPRGLTKKLVSPYVGPFRIVERTSSLNYILRSMETNKVLRKPIHVNRLKLCIERDVRPTVTPENIPQEEEPPIEADEVPTDCLAPDLGVQEQEIEGNQQRAEDMLAGPPAMLPVGKPNKGKKVRDKQIPINTLPRPGIDEVHCEETRDIIKIIKGKREPSGEMFYNVIYEGEDENKAGKWISVANLGESGTTYLEENDVRILRMYPGI
jgi:hypothetical protein